MRVHKEGRVSLLILAVLIVSINYALIRFNFPSSIVYVVAFASLLLYLFNLWFFRVVNRPVISDPLSVMAPCDGRVVVIQETGINEFYQEETIQVSIFMSPLDVHMNWFPIGGKILYSKLHKGSHTVAWAPKASELNEHSSLVIESESKQKVMVRQIAGAMARRVVCYAKEGAYAEQNGNMGFIKFGSRVDLFLPKDASIKVELNQKVVGTQTEIARLK